MIANSAVDYLIGLVPLIGDLFDVGFKANLRNVALLREQLGARKPQLGPVQGETGISPERIADTVAFALGMPEDTTVSEMTVGPAVQAW